MVRVGWGVGRCGDQCHELQICLSASVRLAGVQAKALARKLMTGSFFYSNHFLLVFSSFGTLILKKSSFYNLWTISIYRNLDCAESVCVLSLFWVSTVTPVTKDTSKDSGPERGQRHVTLRDGSPMPLSF